MFGDFLSRLFSGGETPLEELDAQLALSALLVRVARTDGNYAADEIMRIDRILEARFALDRDAAKELRRKAEVIEGQAPDTVRFTRAIKDSVSYDHRIGVVEALWQVVLADGIRDAEEDALLRMTASLLGVSDQDSARARHRASAK